jgi:two-component system response regulator MtrA
VVISGMTGPQRILLVEDHEPLGKQVVAALTDAGYPTDWLQRGDAVLTASIENYSLVILDIVLPGASGFKILEHFRRHDIRTPVLMATAHADARSRQRCLDLGAVDFLTKPFWPRELLARVTGLLDPKPSAGTRARIEIDELTIDVTARTVCVDGDVVALTPAEFDVLAALARRRGATVSRGWLFDQIAGRPADLTEQGVDQCVAQVVRKMGRAGTRITKLWGRRYLLT